MQSIYALDIVEADLDRPQHKQDVLTLTAAYALDPMGNGAVLKPDVVERLIPGLRSPDDVDFPRLH